jgi:glutamate-ammonia-ligase adenylyltransferase
MNPLAAQLIGRLERDEADRDALRRAGDPDPAQAARAFLHAARHPDLAGTCERWVPGLLTSARPGFGAQCLVELADLSRSQRGRPLDLADTPALPGLLGSSNFLARLLLRRPEWIDELKGKMPSPPDSAPVVPDWSEIRRAKYRGLLRVAARDLGDRPFAQSLEELSALADRCLDAGLACAADEAGVEMPALFALGKLGGRELNFSSDVDLLFLYHPPSGVDPLEHNDAVGRLIRHLKGQFEAPSDDGFAYRIDLNLRPEGRSGVLANSVDAALGYYESFGAEWERQMLLRLRFIAGPADAAADFSQGIIPFVYRRHIDPGVMQNVRDMKARIEEERRRAGRDIDADLKEGPGGIRDIEFLVQSFQLFYGGREPELRTGNVLEALEMMGRRGLLPEATVAALANAYLWLRRAEHALQLAEEQQTARFPHERAAQTALARRMSYQEAAGADAHTRLLDDRTWVRSEVRTHFEALVPSDPA